MDEIKNAVRSYIKGSMDISIKLIVKPVEFFQTIPKARGWIDPLLYVVVVTMLGVVLSAFGWALSHGVGFHAFGRFFMMLIIMPLIAVILSFFIAGVYFAIWSFMGSSEDYETSYRCMAYMLILLPISILLSAVPYLGLLGIAWWLYLMVIATREVHKLPVRPALLVFGIIAALSGLVYYNSVSSEIRSREHIEEYTRELQKLPGASGSGSSGKQ